MPFTIIVFLKNDAVRNIVNWLCSFNFFQATLLLVGVDSQVAFTQGHFMNAKPTQEKVCSPFTVLNPTWMILFIYCSIFPENHRKWNSPYSHVREAKPVSVHSGLCILTSCYMWGLSSSSPECPSVDMVSENQAQLMHVSSAKF